MQFMNSSLENFVKNLSDKDFKYLVEEFSSENLELLKQKGAYEHLLKNLLKKIAHQKTFFQFNIKKEKKRKEGEIGNDGKILEGHISFKDYMTCKKI